MSPPSRLDTGGCGKMASLRGGSTWWLWWPKGTPFSTVCSVGRRSLNIWAQLGQVRPPGRHRRALGGGDHHRKHGERAFPLKRNAYYRRPLRFRQDRLSDPGLLQRLVEELDGPVPGQGGRGLVVL